MLTVNLRTMKQRLQYIPWRWITKILFILVLFIPLAYLLYQYKQFSIIINSKHDASASNSDRREGLTKLQHESLLNYVSDNENAVQEAKKNATYYFKKGASVVRFGRCKGKLTLSLVICGDRRPNALVTLKSALAFSLSPLHFVIFADDDNKQNIVEEILDFPSAVLKRLSFEVRPISFPNLKTATEWKKLFKLCASQRLFLPSLLEDLDALIYCDTDVLFLRPLDDLWEHFSKMNDTQMAALSPEHEDFATGWYNRFAKHPFYKPLGVNSGVMLMNLTRMRSFQWETYLEPILHEYKLKIVWGDQDIINIIFHYHPDKLLIFDCDWNFRPDHCMYSRVCKTAEVRGISVLHGNRGVFQNGKQPAFKAVFLAFQSYELGSDLNRHLLAPLKTSLASTINTNCGRNPITFTRRLQTSVSRLQTHKYTDLCNQSPIWGS